MKRIVFLISTLFTCTAAFLFASPEDLETYTLLYNSADTQVEKLRLAQEVVDSEIPESLDFCAMVLDRLLTVYPTIRGNQELDAANKTARLAAQVFGDAAYREGALNLWRVVGVFSEPQVRADALIALGRIGAAEYIPQVVQMLLDLNSRPDHDRLSGERLANGAIIALEHYRDPSGYLPVFFAAVGWYNDWVKNQARSSLPKIMDDPSEPLTSVIKSSTYSYEAKALALQTAENADISGEKKGAIALAAFAEAWRAATANRRYRMELAGIRKSAIRMIGRYGVQDPTAYPLLERSYKEGVDPEEQFAVVATLAALADSSAVRLLSSFLLVINEKLKDGTLTQADERMVRALIPALGATGQAAARPALRAIQAQDWTNVVKRLADEALRQIP
jgi:HEAT repeat protein